MRIINRNFFFSWIKLLFSFHYILCNISECFYGMIWLNSFLSFLFFSIAGVNKCSFFLFDIFSKRVVYSIYYMSSLWKKSQVGVGMPSRQVGISIWHLRHLRSQDGSLLWNEKTTLRGSFDMWFLGGTREKNTLCQ